ncbi:hypothetical protein ACFUAE_32975, partial [Streptomyces ardesiacus]
MSAVQPAAPDRETPGDEAPFAAETSMTSPRIAALAAAVDAGNHAAVEEFWKEAAETGTPLMEPTDDESLTLVRFDGRDHYHTVSETELNNTATRAEK